ncbi:transglycosylase SLT domain-containing protein [Kaarinaea lacus]
MIQLRVLIFGILLYSSSASAVNQEIVNVPVQVDHFFMRQVLLSTLFTQSNQSFRALDDGTGCNFLQLQNPDISTVDGLIRIEAESKARFGRNFGKKCLLLFEWSGKIESFEKLYIDDKRPALKARVVRSNLLNKDNTPVTGSELLWKQVGNFVNPKLESVVLDLAEVQSVMREILPLLMDSQQTGRINQIVQSLSVSDTDINEQGVKITFAMRMPPDKKRLAKKPVKALTEQEMEKLDILFRELDSFVTVIVKKAAGDTNTDELRSALLSVLLDTRYDIVNALQSNHTSEDDPVREIFLSLWQELAPVLREIAYTQPGVNPGISYLSFVTAADALTAIDRVGPELGIEISSDGLKRLARILVPHLSNPFQWTNEVDPQLRELFSFKPLVPNQSLLINIIIDFFIQPSFAQQNIDRTLVQQLNSWVPHKEELETYLPLVERLLRQSTKLTLKDSTLDKSFHPIYQSLVLATAWQESCWRQYVKRRGKQVPLKSGVGAVGMMQVVPRVWRGFYSPKKLQWDIAYNIDAGSEILMRYLLRYAIRKNEHIKTGNPDNLARATYSAYNAGPRKLTRYRWKSANARQRRVDNDFYQRYLTMKENNVHEVAKCY